MAAVNNSGSNSGSKDPYSMLGLDPDATFEEVQQAREKKLLEVGEDPLAKGRIEASYDALLMESLKQRQLGKASSAAVSASKREERTLNSLGGTESSLLTRLKGFSLPNKQVSEKGFMPELTLPEGQGLTIRLALGLLALVLVLVSPSQSIQVILSLSTLGLFFSQIRRGRKPLSSLGWSVLILCVGLIAGGLLITGIPDASIPVTSISRESIEALPAIILIWLGSLMLS